MDVIIYGVTLSSYVQTVLLTCGEKGVSHRFEPVEFRSEAHRKLHPYARVPIIEHGDVRLYETAAIVRYIDEAFDGPSLQPGSVVARAMMEQYIGVTSSYLYPHGIRNYALKYIFAGEGGPDREAIDAALPEIEFDFGVLDAAYAKSEWIAGDSLSLADLFVAPVVGAIAHFPEGAELLPKFTHLERAFRAVEQRASYKALPPV